MSPLNTPTWPTWALALVGLLIGTLARYAMRLQDRLAITWREIVIDLGLMGLNAVLTLWAIERLGAEGKGAVLVGALFAIGQDRIIRVMRRSVEKRATKLLIAAGLGEEVEPEPMPAIGLQAGSPDDSLARLGNTLHAAFDRAAKTHSPEDITAALAALDKED